MNLLTTDSICEAISEESRSRLDNLEVFSEIESTNSYLLNQDYPAPGRFRVALAEYQSAGRGRMNRRWYSPPSSGLCMSLAFTFRRMPKDFPSLSLAIGIGTAQALERLGIHGIGLKWPNDIVARDAKLGGVLCEVRPAPAESVTVVVGIGLNVDLKNTDVEAAVTSRLGPAVDLASCCDEIPSRAVISAALIENLFATMVCFEAGGFSPFHDLWQEYDWLRGQEVMVTSCADFGAGIAEGVDIDGALLVNAKGNTRRFTSGSVTLSGQAGENP